MANTILLKRSAVNGNVPTTAQLSLGELAINTFDGKVYIKKDNGTASIIELTQANLANVTGTLAVGNGGTGATTLTGYVKGAGTSALTASSTIPGSDVSGNITGNSANVTGTVALANGGTGQTTANAALNALLPSQTGNNTKVLSTNGTNASWTTVSAGGSGTVTSVDVSGGTTGLTTSGGPVTTTGTITLAGTLALANGGTGATTQSGAANAVLPAQTSNSGKFLTTDGSNVSWATAGGGGGSTPTLNPLGPVVLEEDFLAGSSNLNMTSAGQYGTAGQFTWYMPLSGGIGYGYQTGEANHPGIFKLGGPSSSGEYAKIFLGQYPSSWQVLASELDTFICIVRVGKGNNGLRIGLSTDFESAFPSQAAYFGMFTGTTWRCYTRNSGETATSAGVSPVIGNWYELKIIRVSSSQFDFYINGSLVASHTANIPSVAMNVGAMIPNDGTSGVYMDFDYIGLKTKAYTQRYT